MTAIVGSMLLAGAVVVAIPTAFFCLECSLGLLPKRSSSRDPILASDRKRTIVVVPAHNESANIQSTLEHLKQQIRPNDAILVVADNCSDDTAQVARSSGAVVIERNEPERRGKGYALSYAAEYLRTNDAPDAVVIFDSDCRISSNGIRDIVALALASHRPVQSDYVMTLPSSASPGARLSAFAFKVRNRIRAIGLQRLGGATHLTGSGMAFPWDVYANAPSMNGHLTEDLALGMELALRGFGPKFSSKCSRS